GLNQVKSFLLVAGARNILSTFVTKDIFDEIWKSSNQISYFAGQLSKGNKELKETVILAGLLHDLGRLVIYSSSDENIKELQKLLKQENSEIQALFQEIRLGVSFPEIGAMLAEKWYFPKPIQYAIRHQMKPLLSESEYIGIIYPIYLARCMVEFLNGTQKFEFIESRVLQYFNLQNQAQFTNLAEDFKSQFVQQYIDS
ncbi:MAG: HDOD domain-containing protein, partial [Leptonema sp. (in: Bacteria)]|nr:HDOD domain-containing protein [Leptonema sp. (in: bacteria)]